MAWFYAILVLYIRENRNTIMYTFLRMSYKERKIKKSIDNGRILCYSYLVYKVKKE